MSDSEGETIYPESEVSEDESLHSSDEDLSMIRRAKMKTISPKTEAEKYRNYYKNRKRKKQLNKNLYSK